LKFQIAAERRASAAPLAGVWSVEDVGKRQVPGNARAADPWSAEGSGARDATEGCGLSGRPASRSVLPGRLRPAHEPRQRCPLHALVGWLS